MPHNLAMSAGHPSDATGKLIAALAQQAEQEVAARASRPKEEEEDESSSEEEEFPPDPQHCSVSGPGFAVGVLSGAVEGGS